jgi:CheY-like chemotaxis protein
MARKILVIDDEPDVREMLKERLEANGYTIVIAVDGEDGLQKVDQESPDLIVLDIMMPKMDGYTFVRELKAKQLERPIPIIMLTAKDMMQDLFAFEGVLNGLSNTFEVIFPRSAQEFRRFTYKLFFWVTI